MKLLITAKGPNLDSPIDKRFGRGEYFVIVDTDSKSIIESFHNEYLNNEHGVGIKTATLTLEKGVDAVITGSYGPKAYDVLKQGTLKLYVFTNENTVQDVLDNFEKGNLKEFTE